MERDIGSSPCRFRAKVFLSSHSELGRAGMQLTVSHIWYQQLKNPLCWSYKTIRALLLVFWHTHERMM